MKQIFITFDLDYEEEYAMIPKIVEELGDTPATFFLVGKFRFNNSPIEVGKNHEIGNHTLNHLDWDKVAFREKAYDLGEYHSYWPANVYRSPHLRHDEEVDEFMERLGYQPELPVSKCPFCPDHYWSNHHVEQGCKVSLEEGFEELCKTAPYVNIFLDPKRLKEGDITKLIIIAKKHGELKRISDYKGSV